MTRYMFNIKKIIRNNFTIDAKDEETAKKIFQLICDKTDILDRFLDVELNDNVEYERNFYAVCEYNNDDNHEVGDESKNKEDKK